MSNRTISQYFAARAAVERRVSKTAADPQCAVSHAEMAARFDGLAAAFETDAPRLRIAIH